MTKPVTYFTQTDQIDRLVERFGSQLDSLDHTEKLALRATLTYYLFHIEVAELGKYTLEHAADETLRGYSQECQSNIREAIAILFGIAEDEVEGLIEALTAQLRWGNTRKILTRHS
jgi:hypothetical protein